MPYKKNPEVPEFTQAVNPRFVEPDPFETRRHWRRVPNFNVKPKDKK